MRNMINLIHNNDRFEIFASLLHKNKILQIYGWCLKSTLAIFQAKSCGFILTID